MRSTITPYVDGYWGPEPEITVIPRPKFPFKDDPTPNVVTRQWERDYRVHPILFSPKIADLTSWTNLLVQSEDLTNASWTKVNLTPSTGTITSPDGLAVMNKVLETITNGEHSAAQAATVTAVPTELSLFVAAGLTREWIRVAFTDSAATVFSAFFNVASGIVGTKSAGVTTAKILPMNKAGVFRVVVQFTPAAGAGTVKLNVASDAATISYAGSTSAGLNLWGAQICAGIESPYVSTISATRTVIAPNRDKADPFAYLVREDEPVIVNSREAIARRLFSRIPLTRVIPSFVRINKPSPPGDLPAVVGQYVVNQPDAAQASYNAYLRQTVISDSGPDITSGGLVDGGTYDPEFDGDTGTATAWNGSASLLAATLNALPSVIARGGCTVTGDSVNGFTVTFATIPLNSINFGGTAITNVINYPSAGGYFQGGGYSGTPGTTFTVTILGQTTAPISINASSGTIQAAINALSNVAAAGGVTVTQVLYNEPGHYVGLFTYIFENPLLTVDTTNLTPPGSTAVAAKLDPFSALATSFTPGRIQSVQFTGGVVGPRDVQTASPHTIVGTEQIFARAGNGFYFLEPGQYSVTGADTLQFTSASGTIASTTDTITEVGKVARSGYSPGTITVRCERTFTYYLPGVTADVDVAADIQPPPDQSEPDTMLALIFSGTGTINWSVGELEAYIGRILQLVVTTVLASDL